jgi:uncharacterized protein (DUF1330 family)
MRLLTYVAGLILAFFLGTFTGHRGVFTDTSRTVDSKRPAYLLASWKVLSPEKLTAFGDTVIPLARKAGMEVLAADSKIEILEGNWPYKGALILERYDSMQALLKFWRSPANRAAQKLREGLVDSEFIVAIESQ